MLPMIILFDAIHEYDFAVCDTKIYKKLPSSFMLIYTV